MYICSMFWRGICAALGAFVVMFWNVENCFDPFDDPLKDDDEFTAGAERHWSWPRFEAKRDGIAQTVMAAGDIWGEMPALVGLAEVENRMVVSQLVYRTPLGEMGYGFVHRDSPDGRGIDVALLYRKDRFRVNYVDSLRIPGTATRDILYLKGVVMPDRSDTLHVFVVHFPSKRGGAGGSADRREAARRVLGRAVDSLLSEDPQKRIIVMGDFNDTDCSVEGLAEPPDEGFLTGRQPTGDYPAGTIKYHGRWERIDRFFLSPAVGAVMRIFAPAFLLEPDNVWLGGKPRRTYAGPRYNRGLSDHLPVILKLLH